MSFTENSPQAESNNAQGSTPVAKVQFKGSLQKKLLVPFGIMACCLLSIFSAIVYAQRMQAVKQEAMLLANAIQRQVAADRSYYTDNVVKGAKKGKLKITADYKDSKEAAIPLPATFVREVANRLNSSASDTEYTLTLKSLYPVNPEQGPADDTEKRYMSLNYKNGEIVHCIDNNSGINKFTLYVPDVASSQSCVDCHNSIADSPKRDYAIGDVMGTLAISIPMSQRIYHALILTIVEISAFSLILVLAGMMIFRLTKRSILKPISSLAQSVTEMAGGNLSSRADVRGDDEIGQLSYGFNQMTKKIRVMIDTQISDRQQLKTNVKKYSEFVEIVRQGQLSERINQEHIEHPDAIERQLAELGSQLNDMVGDIENFSIRTADIGKDLDGVIRDIEKTKEAGDSAEPQLKRLKAIVDQLQETMKIITTASS